MMIIFRYLTREVYGTLLAMTFVLLLVFISNQFIHYLSQAASGGIPARTVMQLMSLQVPLLLGYLLPLGLFLGILLVFGRLYVDNEMTVLAACGVSRLQLLWMTLGFSALIALIVAILMLFVEPKLAWYRDRIFAEAAAASPIETLFPGRFTTLGDTNWAFYVSDISRDRTELNDLFAAKIPDATDPQGIWTVVSAAGGHQWTDPATGDKFMMLTNGYRYLGIPGQRDFQIVKYDEYGVRIETGKTQMQKEAEFLPTKELWQKRKTDTQAAVELQWRLTMPASALILAFIAVPLSRVRPRKGRYAKILPGILLYIVYADLIFAGEAAIRRGRFPVFPGLWWVHGLMFGIGCILLIYYIGWKRIKNFRI